MEPIVSSPAGEPRRVTITALQAQGLREHQAMVGQVQGQLNAFFAAVLAGHDIASARNVRLEMDGNTPVVVYDP